MVLIYLFNLSFSKHFSWSLVTRFLLVCVESENIPWENEKWTKRISLDKSRDDWKSSKEKS